MTRVLAGTARAGAWRWARGLGALVAIAAAVRAAGPEPARVARDTGVAAAIVLLCAITGGSAVRWLAVPRLRALDRLLLAVAAGVIVLGLLALALGAVGWLRREVVLVAAVAAGLASAVHARPWRVVRGLLREADLATRGVDGLALLVAGVLACGALLAAAAAPVSDWDSLMYHLRVPEQFLARGRVFLPPDNEHAGLVGLVHMTYLLAAAAGAPDAATVVSGLFAALLGAAVFAAASRAHGARAGRLAVAGLAGSSVVAFVAVTPRTDASLALFVFLAHAMVLRAAGGRSPRAAWAAGLLAACAVATKIHALAYLAPLAVVAGVLAARRRVPPRALAGGVALAVVLAAPWLVKNWLLLRDPLFPLLAGEQVPPWLAGDERVRAVAASVGPSVVGRAREPLSLAALLQQPGALSPEPEAALYAWSPLLLAGLIGLVVPSTWSWSVPAAGYLVLLVLRTPYTNLRYFVAALPALSVAGAIVTSRIVAARTSFRAWLVPLLTVASLWSFRRPLNAIEARARGAQDAVDLYAIAADSERIVPADGRILMLYDARGRPFRREVLQDNIAITWPLLARSGHAASCLAGLGITHVLLDAGALAFYTARAGAPPEVADGSLRRFVERCLVMEASRGSIALFRVSSPPHARGEALAAPASEAGGRPVAPMQGGR